jgi:hypothetical protein
MRRASCPADVQGEKFAAADYKKEQNFLKKSGIKGLTVVLCEKICVSSCEIPGKVM